MFDLVALAKSGLSIHSAVTGGAFKAALNAIAVVELKAAQNAFSTVGDSAEPREALNRTLTHLETAHVALQKSWSSLTIRFGRPLTSGIPANLDARVCCLIAYIHCVLGDADHLISESLQAAEDALASARKSGAVEVISGLCLVPAFVDVAMAAFGGYGSSCPPIPENEFRDFRELLLANRSAK
jgi:hypothetical protein